jgi:hypothetical protein
LKSHRYLRYIQDLRSDLVPYEAAPQVREFGEFVFDRYPNLGG